MRYVATLSIASFPVLRFTFPQLQYGRVGNSLLLYLSKLGSTAKGGELNDMSISSQRFIPLTRTETDCDKSSRTIIAC